MSPIYYPDQGGWLTSAQNDVKAKRSIRIVLSPSVAKSIFVAMYARVSSVSRTFVNVANVVNTEHMVESIFSAFGVGTGTPAAGVSIPAGINIEAVIATLAAGGAEAGAALAVLHVVGLAKMNGFTIRPGFELAAGTVDITTNASAVNAVNVTNASAVNVGGPEGIFVVDIFPPPAPPPAPPTPIPTLPLGRGSNG